MVRARVGVRVTVRVRVRIRVRVRLGDLCCMRLPTTQVLRFLQLGPCEHMAAQSRYSAPHSSCAG